MSFSDNLFLLQGDNIHSGLPQDLIRLAVKFMSRGIRRSLQQWRFSFAKFRRSNLTVLESVYVDWVGLVLEALR